MTQGKKPRVDRPVDKKLSLPQSLVAKVDLLLFSELEGKVPHGAWSRYVQALIIRGLQEAAPAVLATEEAHDTNN